jgi:hypothetical protein
LACFGWRDRDVDNGDGIEDSARVRLGYPASAAASGAVANGAASDRAVRRADRASEYDVGSASLSSGYTSRDLDRSSSRVRTYGDAPFADNEGVASTRHAGNQLWGLADESIGNAQQAAGGLFGSESLD